MLVRLVIPRHRVRENHTWQWNISHLEMMFPLITIFIRDFPATFTTESTESPLLPLFSSRIFPWNPHVLLFYPWVPKAKTSCLAVFIQADAIAFGAMLDVEMDSWQISLWLLKQMEEHHMRRSWWWQTGRIWLRSSRCLKQTPWE